ncbi:MAG: class I SAM-dependent methyltransferase [Bacteroidia bacterium]|nr:class I SAM-dependent methyltransferase [Bacteroidia bacterium]
MDEMDYAIFGEQAFSAVSNSKMYHIRRHAGRVILDVGCGPGQYIEALTAEGRIVDGVEINTVLRSQAMRYGRTIFNYDIEKGELQKIPAGVYDTVLCLDVLEHVVNPESTLKEMARIAKRNVIISVPLATPSEIELHGLLYSSYKDPTHLRYYTIHELKGDLANAGFKNILIVPTYSVSVILHRMIKSAFLQKFLVLVNRLLLRFIDKNNWSVVLAVGEK